MSDSSCSIFKADRMFKHQKTGLVTQMGAGEWVRKLYLSSTGTDFDDDDDDDDDDELFLWYGWPTKGI